MGRARCGTSRHVDPLNNTGTSDAQIGSEVSALLDIPHPPLDTHLAPQVVLSPLERIASRLEASIKADMERLEASTKADMRALKADIERLENNLEKRDLRLIVKLGLMMAAGVVLLAAMLRMLH